MKNRDLLGEVAGRRDENDVGEGGGVFRIAFEPFPLGFRPRLSANPSIVRTVAVYRARSIGNRNRVCETRKRIAVRSTVPRRRHGIGGVSIKANRRGGGGEHCC